MNWRSRPLGGGRFHERLLPGTCHPLPREGSHLPVMRPRRCGGQRRRGAPRRESAPALKPAASRVTLCHHGFKVVRVNAVGGNTAKLLLRASVGTSPLTATDPCQCRRKVPVSQPETRNGGKFPRSEPLGNELSVNRAARFQARQQDPIAGGAHHSARLFAGIKCNFEG